MLAENPSKTIILIDPSKGNSASVRTDQQRTHQRNPFKLAGILALAFVSIMMAIFYSSRLLSHSESAENTGIPLNVSKFAQVSTDNSCGFQDGNSTVCPKALPCCSQYGWCGATDAYCVNQNVTFSYSEPISNWKTCPNPISNVCADSEFTCCVAPADVASSKFTCRPKNQTSECAIYPSTNSSSTVSVSVSSEAASTTCGGASRSVCPQSLPCCSQYGWCGTSANHCNAFSLSEFSFGGNVIPLPQASVPAASAPVVSSSSSSVVTSSSSSGNMWVTPYQHDNGYTPENWPNPGGCTGTTEILKRAFPTGDILFWTGEQKNEAIKMIAAQYSYRLIASAFAPDTCFRVATLVSAAGVSVQAIVLDFSHVYFSQNVGDVSQAVIDILGGVPDSGHIDIQSISYSEVKTFPKPFGFP